MSNRGTVGRVICFVLGAASLVAELTVAIAGAGMAGTGEMVDGRILMQLGIALGVGGAGWMVGTLVRTQAARVGRTESGDGAAPSFPPPPTGQQPCPQPQFQPQQQHQPFPPQPPQPPHP